MAEPPETWRVEVEASPETVAAFEDALEPFCEALSTFVTETGGGWHIEGFCASRPDPEAIARALAGSAAGLGVAPPPATVGRIPPRDWVADNLRIFPPVEAGRYFIHPSHYRSPVPPGRLALCLDAGAAFGSGEHESTRGVLLALDGLARRRRFHAPLDVGCGSGILALAMARTWRAPVIAADIDPRAIAVTRDNARRNRLGPLVRAVPSDGYRAPAVRRGAPYDLIVSNILANPLCRMAGDLAGHLEAEGTAVLAGFVARDSARVLAAHRRHGLVLVRRLDLDGWQTLVLARDRRAGR